MLCLYLPARCGVTLREAKGDKAMDAQQANTTGSPRDTEETCPNCGMPKVEWMGNNGEGFKMGEKTYCCQGCAIGTGCTCK